VITAGTYDLLIETVCEDNEALLNFLTGRLRRIEGVRETETFRLSPDGEADLSVGDSLTTSRALA